MIGLRSRAHTALETARRVADVPRRYAATLYHQGSPATTYWRIKLPAKYLPGKAMAAWDLSVRHFTDTNELRFPDLRGDTAIVQFPGDNGSAVCCMAFEATGKKFFVEADDNYIDWGDELWRARAGWGKDIGSTLHTVKGHTWIAEHSHGIIVTTRALAEAYGRVSDNVHVCRNSIDPADWPDPAPRDNVFRIGLYASPSHDRDITQVTKALSWASRQPGVEVVNIGLDPGWGFRRRQIAWQRNLHDVRPALCTLDVGVAPLVGTELTMYRSDLKALEYAMGGAMPFLQAAEPYWEWDDKEFVRICHSPAAWMAMVKWAVANQDEVRARAAEAREYVLRERTFRTEINRWREAIGGGEQAWHQSR